MAPCDYSIYPPNWKTEIRPRIMARANNQCEWPGCTFKHGQMVYQGIVKDTKPRGQHTEWFSNIEKAIAVCGELLVMKKLIKVIITIAHLDHDETNHEVKDERLMAMCQLHHLRYDAKEKYIRRMDKDKNKQLNI